MNTLVDELNKLKRNIAQTKEHLDFSSIDKKMTELEQKSSRPDFWKDPKEAQRTMQRLDFLRQRKETWESMEKECGELLELIAVLDEEKDKDAVSEIRKKIRVLSDRYSKEELAVYLSEKYDQRDAILSIYAGAGGVDAQDWAEILERMYLRYFENKGWRTTSLDRVKGDEAGIKSTTIEISVPYAYGYLKSEIGVHRLIRLSPFNADNLRHTSFALVDVLPEVEEKEVEIDPQDLRIETFRASGAGGQHVNVTDSAVRIRHVPTGITVSCQNERSQHQNKEQALKILYAKVHELKEEESKERQAEIRGDIQGQSWGSQIRSYVMHPYTLVKDHRTKLETKNVQKVLDGELDQFIESYLRNFRGDK